MPEEYRGNLGVYNVYNTRIDGGGDGAAAAAGQQQQQQQQQQKRGWFGWLSGGGNKNGDGIGGVTLDPRNNMPTVARQDMAPGQKNPISTSRQVSTIPKSGAGGTWVYPSPQMFYNSLVRTEERPVGGGGGEKKKPKKKKKPGRKCWRSVD